MFRAALFSRDEQIEAGQVRQLLSDGQDEGNGDVDFESALSAWLGAARPAPGALYHEALAAFEKPLFEHALRATGGNQLRAAQLLGINRNTLRKRLDDLAIDPNRFNHRG